MKPPRFPLAVIVGLFLFALFAAAASAQDYLFTTLAGLPGTHGRADGAGSTARFEQLGGIAVDRAGIIYAADWGNHTIRKIARNGMVGTLAGLAGVPGNDDGVGAAARFRIPAGLAVDEAGNVFVADYGSHTIRKITPTGGVTTVAGMPGVAGKADGKGSAARFNLPFDLAIDTEGNLYVVEEARFTLRKVTPDGSVTTVPALSGLPLSNDRALDYSGLTGVAIDAEGTLHVIKTEWHPGDIDDIPVSSLHAITSDRVVSSLTAGDLPIRPPYEEFVLGGLAVSSSGDVFLTNTDGAGVLRISPSGTLATVAGTTWLNRGSADGRGGFVRFSYPTRIAADRSGNLYVVDAGNVIRKGVPVASAGSEPPSRLANLSVRAALAVGQPLIAGAVVSGGAKPLLVRAMGPSLAPLLRAGAVPAGGPRLELYDSAATLIQSSYNWPASLAPTFAAVGAFPLPPGSADAALLHDVTGAHSVHCIAGSGGIGLVEIYDAGRDTAARLTNLSVRHQVGSGDNVLIGGFTIAGTGEKTVLIRGIGPALANAPGIAAISASDMLADPVLEIYNTAGQRFAENDNWSASLASLAAQAGAFALPAGSKDAAVLLSLQPGAYTVVLRGEDGGTGVGLIELYEIQ